MSTTKFVSSSVSKGTEVYYASKEAQKTLPATQTGLNGVVLSGAPVTALKQISIVAGQYSQLNDEAASPTAPGSATPPSPPSAISSGSPPSTTAMSEASGQKTPDPTTPVSRSSSKKSLSEASVSHLSPKASETTAPAASVLASAAIMAALAKTRQSDVQATRIAEWTARYGAALVDSMIPKDVQEEVLTPNQVASYEYLLDVKRKYPRGADKVLPGRLTPGDLPQKPFERLTLYFQIFNLERAEELAKYKEPLLRQLGEENYNFLYEFLMNVGRVIEGIQQEPESPEALKAFHEIIKQHDRFVDIADKAFTKLEGTHVELHRNKELWARLKNGILNFQDSIGIVRDLKEKLQRSKEFWSHLDASLGQHDYSKDEITSLVEMCFSRFSQGHIPAQKSDLLQIKTLLERRRIGAEVAEKLTPMLLNHGAIDGANRKLEETDIFLKAMKAQITLDRHLQKLKLLDQYHLLKEKGRTEVQLLNGLRSDGAYRLAIDEIVKIKKEGGSSSKFSEYELEVAKNLRKKIEKRFLEPDSVSRMVELSQTEGQRKDEIRQDIINSLLANLKGYVGAFDGDVDKLVEELNSDASKREKNPNNDFIDPRSRGVNILLNGVTVFSMVKGSLGLPVVARNDLLDAQRDRLVEKQRLLNVDPEMAEKRKAGALANLEKELADRDSPEEIGRITKALKEFEQADAYLNHINNGANLKNAEKRSLDALARLEKELADRVGPGEIERLEQALTEFERTDADLTRLNGDKRNLNEQIRELEAWRTGTFSTQESPRLPFFNDYYVTPIGNVLYGKMEGKWVVVDLRSVSSKADKERIKAALNPEFLTAQTAQAKPYETLSFDLQLQPLKGKKDGPIKIFYETPKKVKELGDLDFGQRPRLVRKEWRTFKQVFESRDAWPSEELGDHARMMKPEAGRFGGEGWNQGRQRTAAVDSLQAVWTSRLVAADILEGRSETIDWNTLHARNAYFESVKGSDLAKIEGSYSQHENFTQALTLFGGVTQSLTDLIIERLPNESLQLGADARSYDLELGAFKIREQIKFFRGWGESIGKFIAMVAKLPEGRKKDYAFVREFVKIQQAVDTFVKGFPDESLDPETFIFQTLKGNDKVSGFESRAIALYTQLAPLADILESKAFQDRLCEMVDRDRAAINDPGQNETFNQFVLFPLYANSRLTSLLEELAEKIVSELTPLNLLIKNVRAGIKGRVWKVLRNRTNTSKAILNDKHAFENFIRGKNGSAISAAPYPSAALGSMSLVRGQPSPLLALRTNPVQEPADKKEQEIETQPAPISAPSVAALAAAGLDVAGQDGVDGFVGQK